MKEKQEELSQKQAQQINLQVRYSIMLERILDDYTVEKLLTFILRSFSRPSAPKALYPKEQGCRNSRVMGGIYPPNNLTASLPII